MVDPTHMQRSAAASAGAAPIQKSTSASASSGADMQFRGLLERLEDDARRLQEQSVAVADPQSLERALDRAQASLHDALALGDRLLEAYRATLVRAGETGADVPGAQGSRR